MNDERDGRRTSTPEGGFTLMEVMATLVIVSVVLLSILAIRSRNLQDAARARDVRFANLLAQRSLEEAMVGIEPDYEGVPEGFTVGITNQVETVGDEQQVVLITVEVTYPVADGKESVILSSYRLPFEGEELETEEGE